MEASATWMEDQVFTAVNDYVNYLPDFLNYPERSLDSVEGNHEYAAALWAKYISEKEGGIGKIKAVWNACIGSTQSLAAMRTVFSFDSAFENFCVFNYTKEYAEGNSYPSVYFNGSRSSYSVSSTPVGWATPSSKLPNYLASNYIKFMPGGNTGSLVVYFDGDDRYSWASDVVAKQSSGYNKLQIPLNFTTKSGSVYVENFGTKYNEVVLIPIVRSTSGSNISYQYTAVIDPDGDPARASSLPLNSSTGGNVAFDNDRVDWSKITLSQTSNLNISMIISTPGENLYLSIYNSSILSNPDASPIGTSTSFGTTQQVILNNLSPGTYYIKAYANGPLDSSNYSLSASTSSGCTGDVGEPNDTFGQAYTLSCNSSFAAKICSATDQDYYRVAPSSTGTLTITLTPPSDRDYDLYIYNSSQTQLCSSTLGTGIQDRCSVSVTGGQTYYIKIIGFAGAFSTSIYSLGISCPSGPSLPGPFNLTATPECNGSSPQIRLNWTASSGAQNYDVYRNNSLLSSNLTGTQFINTTVTAGTSYNYFIRAKNSAGSTDSNPVSSVAPSNCGISPPGAFNLTLTPECNGSSPQIRLNWSVSSGAQNYDVYRNGSLYFSNITGTQFINTTVTAGTSYSYFVRAKNPAGTRDSNSTSAAAPTNCGISSPGAFTLTLTPECSGTSPQIRLNWTPSSNAQSYDIYRNGSLYFSNITGTQFINTAVTAGTNYSYFVRASNAGGTRDSNSASAPAPSNCAPANPFLTRFDYTPKPPRAGRDITFQFWGGNFVSGLTQVWFFGPGCSNGCQHPPAGVFVSTNAYMEARNVRLGTGTYSCYLKNGSSGNWVLAGTFNVSP